MKHYPKRDQHFAHRFVRRLTKAAIANQVGADVCWLLTVIAHQEDAKRYSGPVTFWNQQLMVLVGVCSQCRLTRIRKAAIDAGWLHYRPGGKGMAGVYWVLTPEWASKIDDGVTAETEENTSPNDLHSRFDAQNGCANRRETEENQKTTSKEPERNQSATRAQPERKPQSFYPNPIPIPNPNPKEKEKADADASGSPKPVPEEFSEVWEAYRPTTRGGKEKPKALTEWRKTMRVLSAREEIGDAHCWLLGRVTAYAKSGEGRGQFAPTFERWLKNGKYDDDPSKWVESIEQRAGPSLFPARQTVSEHNREAANRVLERINAARQRDADCEASGPLRIEGNEDRRGGADHMAGGIHGPDGRPVSGGDSWVCGE